MAAAQQTALTVQRIKDSNTPTHIPTPPHSPQDAFQSPENALISISTTFFPGAPVHSSPSDLVLLSSDSVFFYVHSCVLLSASQNHFASLLPAEPMTQDNEAIVPVPEPADVLNIALHAFYDISCTHYSPSLPTLSAAIDAAKAYGLDAATAVRPTTPLFTLLLSHAPVSPLDIYALAAHHGLHDLAVSASPHLLSFPLHTLSDAAANTIGPVYLKRLFFLHLGRADALKRLLLPPPHPHAPTPTCDFADQKKLTRAWALASAYLAWDARPDMPASTLEFALAPLGEHLLCEQCRDTLKERIHSLVVQWSVVKRTI